MTEAEWLAATDPRPMLLLLKGVRKPRKFRLFAAACVRFGSTSADPCANLVAYAEQYADSQIPHDPQFLRRNTEYGPVNSTAAMSITGVSCSGMDAIHVSSWLWFQRGDTGLLVATETLRDIFGNPFRPVAINPDWLTSDVVAMCRGMYETRDFAAMPILADALQEAGCENADVLSHCRGNGPHIRGCWVVDLMLGKE